MCLHCCKIICFSKKMFSRTNNCSAKHSLVAEESYLVYMNPINCLTSHFKIKWKLLDMPCHPLVILTITVVWQKTAMRETHWVDILCLAWSCHTLCLFQPKTAFCIYPWCKQKLHVQLFIIQEMSSANNSPTTTVNMGALFTLLL